MIPKEFHGLPLHALAVHAAVVLVPLAALLAILFVIPLSRRWAAVPMALVSLAALISVYVARESGFNLKNFLLNGNPGFRDIVANHQHQASLLVWFMLGFTIIALVVFALYRRADRFTGVVQYAACLVLIVGALVVAWQTYKTGEAGSKIVYNPSGNVDYGSAAIIGR